MTEQELIELCSLGESTTVQYKLEFTTQKQIAEELVNWWPLPTLGAASSCLVLRTRRAGWWGWVPAFLA